MTIQEMYIKAHEQLDVMGYTKEQRFSNDRVIYDVVKIIMTELSRMEFIESTRITNNPPNGIIRHFMRNKTKNLVDNSSLQIRCAKTYLNN